jgi:hypothetical protein
MAADKPPTKPLSPPEEKKRAFYPYQKKSDDSKKDDIPMLKFSKRNSFFKLSQALAEVSLKEYGNFRRLIKKVKSNIPVFVPYKVPAGSTLDADEERALKIEAVK